ncbi:hypothetical protein CDL12_21141 [Handroanthus impetiginosus]|uniref:Uncharacterized protein n=1 Tax=Handroanthus impetiginosus TaxID=429701 RepID=A0A2G9GLY6_9LAMI|nr:hypothetical protein CDL12_21141 [Handroanthus impetiginosus]
MRPYAKDPEASGSDRVPEPESLTNESAELSATSTLTSSKRWRDIFKKNDKKSSQICLDDRSSKEKDYGVKEKKREKKNGGVGVSNGVSAAELNINIWPFSRSRSAGNGGPRPRSSAAARKVSSAPCSRSNSAGESKSRKWPSSPGRAGVHLGRSSPVWQARRNGGGRSSEAVVKSADKGLKKDGNESRRKIPTAASGGGGGSKAKVASPPRLRVTAVMAEASPLKGYVEVIYLTSKAYLARKCINISSQLKFHLTGIFFPFCGKKYSSQ